MGLKAQKGPILNDIQITVPASEKTNSDCVEFIAGRDHIEDPFGRRWSGPIPGIISQSRAFRLYEGLPSFLVHTHCVSPSLSLLVRSPHQGNRVCARDPTRASTFSSIRVKIEVLVASVQLPGMSVMMLSLVSDRCL